MQECITNDVLRNYLAGLVTPDVSHSLETHLQSCPQCQALVARFTPQPEPLLEAAREEFALSAVEREPELVSVLSVIGGLRSHPDGSSPNISVTQEVELPVIRDYQILKKLGEGGMGTVYLAMHTRLGKKVAVKILKADLNRNPQAIARFEREWLAVGKLEHPHIVRAHHAGDENGTYFLVMEYIAGPDLGRLLQKEGPLAVPLACKYIQQAALGLQHAHDHDMVHRDVKPSNLILAADGQVKVLDLGLAQLQVNADDSNELTREGQLVGTWLYMAPEQLSPDGQADSRSDIFSLGVTFYNFLVGPLPLSRGQTATQLPAIGTKRTDVPPDVQALLAKMLAPNPVERIQTMTEVANVLEIHAKSVSGEFLCETGTKDGSITDRVPNSVSPLVVPSPKPQVSIRSYWRHLAVAGAGVVTLLVVIAMVIANGRGGGNVGRKPEPIPVIPVVTKEGTVFLAGTDKAGPPLPAMFAASKGEKIDLYPLKPGPNQLPPGTYYVYSEHQDWLPVPEEIVIRDGSSTTVAVRQLPHVAWLFPRLPDQAGAYMEGGGTLWMEGMVDKKGNRFELPYKLRISMGDAEEFVDEMEKKVPCRWMAIEVNTHGPKGVYTETGRLLVDIDEYRRSQSLSVKRGWLTGGSKNIESRLRYLFGRNISPKEPPVRLAVKFDKSLDAIQSRADELLVRLPEPRISVQDALNLLFGADFQSNSAPLREVRLRLAKDTKREGARELVAGGPHGDLYCWGVKSDEAFNAKEKSVGYSFYRHEAVPFSVVRIDANLEKFQAGFNLTGYGPVGERSAETVKAEVAQAVTLKSKEIDEVEAFALLQRREVKFDESSLPEFLGATATYDVGISREGKAEQLFEVRLRMADTKKPGELRRWLEATVTSKTGEKFKEEALLQVLDLREKGGKFLIEKGWIRAQEEIFPFETGGDRAPLNLGLLKLGKKRIDSPLTIHDVLALLFGAELKETQKINTLRTFVATTVAKIGLKRAWSSEDPDGKLPIVLFDTTRRAGEIWTVSAPPKLNYSIWRSGELPFDFQKVVFGMPGTFELTSVLATFEDKDAPSLLSPMSKDILALAAEYEEIVKASHAKVVAENENWREWGDVRGSWWEWAEFRGQLKNGTVLLKCKRESSGFEERRVPLQSLRQEDRDWVAAGRFWYAAVGSFKRQAVYVRKSGPTVTLKETDGKEIFVSFEKLSESDKEWIRYLELQLLMEKTK